MQCNYHKELLIYCGDKDDVKTLSYCLNHWSHIDEKQIQDCLLHAMKHNSKQVIDYLARRKGYE